MSSTTQHQWPEYPEIPTSLDAIHEKGERGSGSFQSTFRSSSEISHTTNFCCEQSPRTGLGIANAAPPAHHHTVRAPPNIAQRIEKRLWNYNASGSLIKSWLLEILSWVTSAICMGAIVLVLLSLQNKKIPRWPLGLTLNTYIAVLSRFASASLLLPVSEALGQLKWSWFFQGDAKKMWDFEIFDNASRGPWGSIMLLVRTRCQNLSSLGAAITLFILILDPFFQQVVDFPERWALTGQSSIPRLRYYDPRTPKNWWGVVSSETDLDIVSLAQKFFYDNGTQPMVFGNSTRPDIPLNCPTTNCTWPPYETLGLCSACKDVSDILTYGCRTARYDWDLYHMMGEQRGDYNLQLMCGYFLNFTSEFPILMSGYTVQIDGLNHTVHSNATQGGNQTDFSGSSSHFNFTRTPGSNYTQPQTLTYPNTTKGAVLLTRNLPLVSDMLRARLYDGSINFRDYGNPLVDFIISRAKNGREGVLNNERPDTHECVLAWCVKKIESSYYAGTYEEKIVDIFINKTQTGDPWKVSRFLSGRLTYVSQEYVQNITITVPGGGENSTFGLLDVDVMIDTIYIFDDFFPSFTTAENATSGPILRYRVNALEKFPSLGVLENDPWKYPNNITNHIERLATAFTNVLRTSSGYEWIYGSAYATETFVQVRWGWLALPVLLLVSSFIFLSATIYRAWQERNHVDVLKTSAIATLMYGLPDNMQRSLTTSTGSSEIGTPRTKAKDLRVKLLPSKKWRASGLLSPTMPMTRRYQPPPGWI